MPSQKPCIFCGSRAGLSKEHFWPAWLGPYLEDPLLGRHVSVVEVSQGKLSPEIRRKAERQGSVFTKKIRAVCSTCNNGWMSRLEIQVKPTLLGLIEGKFLELAPEQTDALARWVTAKVIVGEHATEDVALTPVDDRQLLACSGKVPEYFRIFLGRHQLRFAGAYKRHSATLSRTLAGPVPPLSSDLTRNTQTTTFLVGQLVFYVHACRAADFDPGVLDPTYGMVRLLPPSTMPADLGTHPPLTAAAVSTLSQSLQILIGSPQVRYAGPVSARSPSAA